MGKYHPHGDQSIYDTLVRMAQDFSMRYPLVDGQGNFGSVDGDRPAAMRYTEARMARITHEMLARHRQGHRRLHAQLRRSNTEPTVLPARFPNLLVNGSTGIAVGMATNIPPHNLAESIDATVALIDNPEIELDGLMEHMPGPDFPTGAASSSAAPGIRDGIPHRPRPRAHAGARPHRVDDKRQEAIIVTELPYHGEQGATTADHEDRRARQATRRSKASPTCATSPTRTACACSSSSSATSIPEVVLEQALQAHPDGAVFGINMVALVDGVPQLLNLKEMLDVLPAPPERSRHAPHEYRLRKAEPRAHILAGLMIASATSTRSSR